ncbi:MAG: hypothetical protein L0Y36_00825 [Planctomycetales bacterium]|nr:hypothetical protein [Planctomycetales bacterium]
MKCDALKGTKIKTGFLQQFISVVFCEIQNEQQYAQTGRTEHREASDTAKFIHNVPSGKAFEGCFLCAAVSSFTSKALYIRQEISRRLAVFQFS